MEACRSNPTNSSYALYESFSRMFLSEENICECGVLVFDLVRSNLFSEEFIRCIIYKLGKS